MHNQSQVMHAMYCFSGTVQASLAEQPWAEISTAVNYVQLMYNPSQSQCSLASIAGRTPQIRYFEATSGSCSASCQALYSSVVRGLVSRDCGAASPAAASGGCCPPWPV